MLASSKIIGFVPTRDTAKARAFYEGKLEFQFVSDDPVCLGHEGGRNHDPDRQSAGFHSGTIHRPGLGSPRYRSRCRLAAGAGSGFREISFRAGSGTGNLDRARREQGCVVQRSGRECALPQPARVKSTESLPHSHVGTADSRLSGGALLRRSRNPAGLSSLDEIRHWRALLARNSRGRLSPDGLWWNKKRG